MEGIWLKDLLKEQFNNKILINNFGLLTTRARRNPHIVGIEAPEAEVGPSVSSQSEGTSVQQPPDNKRRSDTHPYTWSIVTSDVRSSEGCHYLDPD